MSDKPTLPLEDYSELKALANTNAKLRTYISLFSCAGVGCYGFKQNGFLCVATNELIPVRLNVQRANNKCILDSGYICGDITQSETQDAIFREVEKWEEYARINSVDVVFATPPCQGMSTANYKKNEHEQVRNSLVVEAIKMIKKINPKIFVFENVKAFLKTTCTDINGEDVAIESCIIRNLGNDYHIYSTVINFKDYGVPSSRPRTIVIGTRKSLQNIAPLNLFPTRQNMITLREAIGDLQPLDFGEKSRTDIYHFARKFPEYQLPWIENLDEGQSAFSQTDPDRVPHKIDAQGNKVVLKGAYMGNKYRRLCWDKPCSCIATRNDQLASQDTIHPRDNRVLSIRELMRIMTIPEPFCWAKDEKRIEPIQFDSFLSENELNIRRCIGEAVPTHIISDIASKINNLLDFEDFVNQYYSKQCTCLGEITHNYYIDAFVSEQQIIDAKSSGSYYTPQSVVFDALKSVAVDVDELRILEPSVGLGAFLPQLSSVVSECKQVTIDVVEISPETLCKLMRLLNDIDLGSNIKVNFICDDFLTLKITQQYNLVVANPPYGKTAIPYPNITQSTHKTKNLFALFMLKYHSLADNIVCVIPKNFAIADEFYSVRKIYEDMSVVRVCDFGVKSFKKVFVEIISIHFDKKHKGPAEIVDYINGEVLIQPNGYIYHDTLWLLYRNQWFDEYYDSLILDAFDFFRDRQITNSVLQESGKIRVLRSKNIQDDGSIVNIEGYDRYIDDVSKYGVSKYLNTDAIIMPNFTYNTRATILPKNTIPNGSIAVLIPTGLYDVDLQLYSTAEFRNYYSIVKCRSKFTLNIDHSSIHYIGITK